MRQLRAWWQRMLGFLGKRADEDISAELEDHLQMHIEDNLRSGMSPEEARRNALMKSGGIEQAKQAYRERDTLPWL
ncbi:MAG TPA: permease prefix domain 1-containing protein, partial [Acidobacteriaceae bacterium]